MSRIPDYMQPVDMALRDAITRPSPRERLIAEHDDYDHDRLRQIQKAKRLPTIGASWSAPRR